MVDDINNDEKPCELYNRILLSLRFTTDAEVCSKQ